MAAFFPSLTDRNPPRKRFFVSLLRQSCRNSLIGIRELLRFAENGFEPTDLAISIWRCRASQHDGSPIMSGEAGIKHLRLDQTDLTENPDNDALFIKMRQALRKKSCFAKTLAFLAVRYTLGVLRGKLKKCGPFDSPEIFFCSTSCLWAVSRHKN
jgi:hypothetical protein